MVPFKPDIERPVRVDELARGQLRVALSGSLDLANAHVIGDQLRAAMSRGQPDVLVVDAGSVDFCDCSSLQMLIDVHGEGTRAGTRVVISVASPVMAWLLRLFALDELFDYPPGGPVTGASTG